MSQPDEVFGIQDVYAKLLNARARGDAARLTALEVQSLVESIKELQTYEAEKDPETYRREAPSMSTNPIVGMRYDYAQAGTLIDKAIHHLDEGLPIGQRLRCETAFRMLRDGVFHLEKWMRAAGYSV